MTDKQPTSRLTDFASSANAAILLSVLYPTLFAFSQNWHTASGREWVFLAALAFAFGLVITAIYHVLTPFATVLLSRVAGLEETNAKAIAQAILLAVACVVPFFLLFDGTFRDMLGGPRRALALQIATLAAAAWLFRAGHAAKYSTVLAMASAVSIVGFAERYLYAPQPDAGKAEIAKSQDFETATLKRKPNIYFFIYDAYGSKHVYSNNFGFDNSKQYAELEKRGFRVVHTLSNYANTWGTTLSFFSGSHHYYTLNFGNDDTTAGRDVLNGNAHNPVIETLKQNGYRVQFVHPSNYLVRDKGHLDIAFPANPLLNVLQLYGSERLDELNLNHRVRKAKLLEQQDNYLLERIPQITKADAGPWFTFFWKPLPSHANKRLFFTKQPDFAAKFIERTQQANERMLPVVDRIRRDDPSAIVMIIGDHGAWRYSGAASTDPDPNKAFKKHGIGPETATLDFFGVMIAIRSGGLCDYLVYPGITPVNVMRVVFACLAERRDLLEGKAEDISIFRASNKLWLTGRDGNVLPHWQAFEAPN